MRKDGIMHDDDKVIGTKNSMKRQIYENLDISCKMTISRIASYAQSSKSLHPDILLDPGLWKLP